MPIWVYNIGMKIVLCNYCKKELKVYPKAEREGRGKYCSRQCYYDGIKAKVYDYTCNSCQKIFQLPNWRNYIGKTKYFCTMDCYRVYIKIHPEYHQPFRHKKMDIHPILTKEILEEEYLIKKLRMRDIAEKYKFGYVTINYWINKYKIPTRKQAYYLPPIKSFEAIKKKLIEKRGNKCEMCGWGEAQCDVHHRLPRSDKGGHDERNLIILCPNHHRIVTQQKLMI